MVEKISAVTLRVANMQASEVFYRDLVGLKVVYGGEDAYFSSLRRSVLKVAGSIEDGVVLALTFPEAASSS